MIYCPEIHPYYNYYFDFSVAVEQGVAVKDEAVLQVMRERKCGMAYTHNFRRMYDFWYNTLFTKPLSLVFFGFGYFAPQLMLL